jgi:hypothetical protein
MHRLPLVRIFEVQLKVVGSEKRGAGSLKNIGNQKHKAPFRFSFFI